jgi:hypothetical protein
MIRILESDDLSRNTNECLLGDVFGTVAVPGQHKGKTERVGGMQPIKLSQAVLAIHGNRSQSLEIRCFHYPYTR